MIRRVAAFDPDNTLAESKSPLTGEIAASGRTDGFVSSEALLFREVLDEVRSLCCPQTDSRTA
jgi:hypothetical protein